MGQMVEWGLVALAYVVALVLAALGVRCLKKQNRGRCGIFMAALSFFLMGDAAFAQDSAAQKKQPASSQTSPKSKLPLPPELAAPGRWEAFKAFWQKLDAIDTQPKKEPAKTNDAAQTALPPAPSDVNARMAGVLEEKEIQSLRKELDALFPFSSPYFDRRPLFDLPREVAEKSPSALAQILYFFAVQRLSDFGPDYTMLTRMIPSFSMTHPRTVQQRLEVRIDLLMKKQADGDVSAKEYAAIMTSIDKDMHLLALLSVLSSTPYLGQFWGPVAKEDVTPTRMKVVPSQMITKPMNPALANDPAAWLRGMEHAYKSKLARLDASLAKQTEEKKKAGVQKTIADLEAGMTRTREHIAELDKLRAPLRVLLEDLERRPTAK